MHGGKKAVNNRSVSGGGYTTGNCTTDQGCGPGYKCMRGKCIRDTNDGLAWRHVGDCHTDPGHPHYAECTRARLGFHNEWGIARRGGRVRGRRRFQEGGHTHHASHTHTTNYHKHTTTSSNTGYTGPPMTSQEYDATAGTGSYGGSETFNTGHSTVPGIHSHGGTNYGMRRAGYNTNLQMRKGGKVSYKLRRGGRLRRR